MNKEIFHFKIGTFECISIADGGGPAPANVFFANAPKDELERALHEHGLQPDSLSASLNILYLNTGRHRLLVDSGTIPGTNPTAGRFMTNLVSAGISPDDIDTIIITHAHGDHYGGLVDGDGQFVFSNARYIMSAIEWRHWTNPDTLAKLSETQVESIRHRLMPIESRLTLIDSKAEILPGLRAIPAPGHTPGQIALSIESGGERLLHIADAAHHPIQAEHSHWSPVFDAAPEQSPVTRRTLFERAAKEEALLMAYHFRFPGVGRLQPEGTGWVWTPLSQ